MNTKIIPTYKDAASGMCVQSVYKNYAVGYYNDGLDIEGKPIVQYDTNNNYIPGILNLSGNYVGGVFHGFIYDFNTEEFTILDNCNAGTGQFQGTFAFGIHSHKVVGSFTDNNNVDRGFIYNMKTKKWETICAPNTGIPNNWKSQAELNYWYLGAKPIFNPGTVIFNIYDKTMVGYYVDINQVFHGFIYDGLQFLTVDNPNWKSNYTQDDLPCGTFLTGIYEGNVIGGYYNTWIPNALNYQVETDFYRETCGKYQPINNPLCSGTYSYGLYKDTVVGVTNDNSYEGFNYNLSNKSITTFEFPDSSSTQITGKYRNKTCGFYNKNNSFYSFILESE